MKILILGGSQGSKSLNLLLPKVLFNIEDLFVKHQCGKNNFEETEIIYQKHANDKNKIEIIEYIDNIHEYYGWADIIICRAGALTVSEVSASGSLGIFIPLPWAIDNHQFFNAKQLKDLNAGFLIEENENLEQDLIKILNDIKKIEIDKLRTMKENSYKAYIKSPERKIYDEVAVI